MSHFADEETLALIARLQGELTDSQHKVKVLTDALEYHQQQTRPIGRTIEALAAVKELK